MGIQAFCQSLPVVAFGHPLLQKCSVGMSLSLCPPLSPTTSHQMDGRGPGRFEVAWECQGRTM